MTATRLGLDRIRRISGRRGPGEADAAVGLDRRSIVPAALAALAEGAVVFLPLRAVAADGIKATGGPLFVYPAFLGVLVGSVALATAFRRFKELPMAVAAGAIVVGIAQGQVWGPGTLAGTVTAIVVALTIGFRVTTLALRDWREPMRTAFGAGAVGLLVEVVIAAGGTTNWRPLLAPLIAQFFVAALASRAASLRLDRHPATESVEGREPRRWLRSIMVLVAGLGLLLLVAFVFGRRGGLLQVVGNGVYRLGIDAIAVMAFVLAKVLLRPFHWALATLQLRLPSLTSAAQSLEGFARKPHPRPAHSGQTQTLSRLFGLLLFVLLGGLLIRAMRRQRELADRFRPSDLRPLEVEDTPFAHARARRLRRQLQRELPEDTIRRWYAQTLLALERRGVPKPSSTTPGEYLVEVTAALPACAAEFTVLTRAYEDVRYGNRPFDGASIERLEPHRALLMQTLRRAPKEEG